MPSPGALEPKLRPPRVYAARWVLFALLLTSAALVVFGLPGLHGLVAAGKWPRAALAVPPVLLGAFVVGFAAYRLVLVRAGRYSAGKALVQTVVMALLLGIVARAALVPGEVAGPPAANGVGLARPLASPDPDVRAIAAEVVRHRPRREALSLVGRLSDLVEDPSAAVRREAHASLVALAGRDAGGEGPGASARWREHWRRSGVLR